MRNKTLIYSNFKFNPIINNDNQLNISSMYNVNLDNGSIKTEIHPQNILNELFDSESVSLIKDNNTEIINKIKRYIPYNFYNVEQNSYNIRLFAISDTHTLYELKNDTKIFELKYKFLSYPKIIESDNNIYIFDNNDTCVIIYNQNALQIEKLPKIKDHLKYNDSLFFCVEQNISTIFIAEECDIKDLSLNLDQYSSLKINLENGPILKIVNLKNKIYVITKYSILKFDDENNRLVNQSNIELEIFDNTISQVDDNLFFYTSNGLYYFNGNNIEHVFNNYLFISKNAKMINFNQNLYIIDEIIKDIIYRYNIDENYIIPIKIKNLDEIYVIKNFINYNLCASFKEEDNYHNITFYNQSNDNTFTQEINFHTTSFNSSNIKHLNSIIIKCVGSFILSINSDITQANFNISDTTKLENLSIPGVLFDFTIKSNSNLKIDSMIINFREVGD